MSRLWRLFLPMLVASTTAVGGVAGAEPSFRSAGLTDGASSGPVSLRGAFVPTLPVRLMDSRQPASPTVDGLFEGIGVRAAGSVTELSVVGRGGVPDGVGAVALNVTVVGAQGAGFVTVWPCGAVRPNASNLNFVAGQTIPNAVVAKVGVEGKVCLFAEAATHLIVDLAGYFEADAPFVSAVPVRLMDSRQPASPTVDGLFEGIGVRVAGSVTELSVVGRGGVPDGVGAVALNVTVVGAQGAGFVTVWPCGAVRPNASNLNFVEGQTIPNAVVAKVGVEGKVCLFAEAATHLIVDLAGYFEADAPFVSAVPVRLMDSRQPASPTVDGLFEGIGVRAAGSVTELSVVGRGGVPDGVGAVALNVTVVGALGAGFVTVWPCGAVRPNASNLNFVEGQTIPNAVVAKVGVEGKVCLFAEAATHLIVDLDGYVMPSRYLVVLAKAPWSEGTDAAVYQQELAALKAQAAIPHVIRDYSSIPVLEVILTRPEQVTALRQNPFVQSVSAQPDVAPPTEPTSVADPYINAVTVAETAALTGAATLHAQGHTGVGTTVAVIDDFLPAASNHALNVTGIVRGIAPGASILLYGYSPRVLTDGREYDGLASAVNDIVGERQSHRNVVAVNMSFTETVEIAPDVSVSTKFTPAECAADTYYAPLVNALHAAGVSVIAAAGNDGYRDGLGKPACLPGVVAVGATYGEDQRTYGYRWGLPAMGPEATCTDANAAVRQPACFTNVSTDLDIWAPGFEITAQAPGSGTVTTMSGTSMASPHVAAVIAILRGQYPGASWDDIERSVTACSPFTLSYGGVFRPFLSADHPCPS